MAAGLPGCGAVVLRVDLRAAGPAARFSLTELRVVPRAVARWAALRVVARWAVARWVALRADPRAVDMAVLREEPRVDLRADPRAADMVALPAALRAAEPRLPDLNIER